MAYAPSSTRRSKRSQQLVVETIVDDKNPTKLMSAMRSLGFSPGLPPLAERVPPAKRAALAAAIKKSGVPAAGASTRWRPGPRRSCCSATSSSDMGLKGGEGVEACFATVFTDQGKPIGELETNVEQLGYFDRLPEKGAARAARRRDRRQPKERRSEFNGMLTRLVARRRQGDRPDASTSDLRHRPSSGRR